MIIQHNRYHKLICVKSITECILTRNILLVSNKKKIDDDNVDVHKNCSNSFRITSNVHVHYVPIHKKEMYMNILKKLQYTVR